MGEWQTAVDEDVEQRIIASADHREGDRVPVWDCLESPALIRYFQGEGDDAHAALAKAYGELGIDLCTSCSVADEFATEADAGDGRSGAEIRTVEQLEGELEGGEYDWGDLRGQLLTEYFANRDLVAPRTMYVPGGSTGFHALCYSVGLERFSRWTYEHPDLIEAVLDRYAHMNALWSRTVAEEKLCPLFFVGDDIAAKGRLLFSPAYLRRAFVPRLKQICEPLKAAGMKVIFHSDGNIMEILEDLIEAGVDGLHPIEPLAGMDISDLKGRYGDRLILVGNVDASQLLTRGTPKEIRAATSECIAEASPGGGHFIGSSGGMTPAIPLENIFAFYGACRELGSYPINICGQS